MSITINIIFSAIMLLLAFVDVRSYLKKEHKDLKSAILSLGILGTFFGIFIGLLGFNTADIQESVPKLLEGLKVAFFTSIAGMSIAILLFVFQKFNPQTNDSDIEFGFIREKLKKLDLLDGLEKLENLNYLEMLKALYHQKSIDGTSQESLKVLQEINQNIRQQHDKTQDLLIASFEQVMAALQRATEEIARGASKEIINALETVIKDFNNNLNEQFGDNFKELNKGVHNLIEWQHNYKSSIETSEKALKLASDSIQGSKETLEQIASKNNDVLKVYQELSFIINTYNNQIKTLNAQLQEYERLGQHSQEMIEHIKHGFDISQEKFATLTHDFYNKLDETKNNIYAGIEQLQQHSSASNEQMLSQTRELFDAIKNTLHDTTSSTTQNIATAFSLLEEKNTHIFADIARSNTEAMLGLQRNQETVGTEIHDFLHGQVDALKNSALTFKDSLNHAREAILENNKEAVNAISNHTIANMDELKDFYKTSFEEENKNAADALNMARENFNAYIRKSFDETASTISSLGQQLKESLETSGENFKNHIAKLNDDFLASIDKITQKTFDALNTSQNKLNDYIDTVSEDIRTLSNSLIESVGYTQKSVQTLAEDSHKQMLSLSENSQATILKLYETSKSATENMGQTLQTTISQTGESAQNSIEKSFVLSTKAHRELTNEALKMLKSLSNTNSEIVTQQKLSLEENEKAFKNFSENSKLHIASLLTSIDEFNTEFTVSNSETIKKMSEDIRLGAKESYEAFQNLTQKTMEQIRSILENATADYIKTLEKNANEGKDIPLKIAQNIKNSFFSAQKELAEYSKSTNSSIYNTKNLIEKLIAGMNENMASQISQNQTLNDDLLKSLRALDNSMQVVVKNFKNDYDWLLRRIRELMGSDRL